MFDPRTTYAADYGKRKYTAVTPDGVAVVLSTSEFIGLDWIADGSTLVIEDAHVKYIRTFEVRSSLSQPLSGEDQSTLVENAKRKRVDIRIFSCGLTRKVFSEIDPEYAAIDSKNKDDETDARLILRYFTTVARQVATRPLRPYSKDLDAMALKRKTDEIINTARSSWGVDGGATLHPSVLEYTDGDIDNVASELLSMGLVVKKTSKGVEILDERLDTKIGGWLLDRYGSTVAGERRAMTADIIDRGSFTFLYTLMCCVIDPLTGERTSQLNHREIQSVLLTPSDKRAGGVARSNVYWHYIRARHINAAMKERDCPCGSKPVNYKGLGKGETVEAHPPCDTCKLVRSEYLAAARVGVRLLLRLFIEWIESDEQRRDVIYRDMQASINGCPMMF